MKTQLLVEFETGQIIATAVDKGTVHDFKLFKRSRLPFMSSQLCLADRGYQGFAKIHTGARLRLINRENNHYLMPISSIIKR